MIPDPNRFTGRVKITRVPTQTGTTDLARAEAAAMAPPTWHDVPVTGMHAERGIGVLDLARAARTGRQALASGELALHVLDTLLAIDEAVTTKPPSTSPAASTASRLSPTTSTPSSPPSDWRDNRLFRPANR